MGTRGAYGLRIHRNDHVTYNHFDSYPDCLGRSMMIYIVHTPLEEIKESADKIILVNGESTPSSDIIKNIGNTQI